MIKCKSLGTLKPVGEITGMLNQKYTDDTIVTTSHEFGDEYTCKDKLHKARREFGIEDIKSVDVPNVKVGDGYVEIRVLPTER